MKLDLTKTNGSSPPAGLPTQVQHFSAPIRADIPLFRLIPAESPELPEAATPSKQNPELRQRAKELSPIHQAVLDPQVNATIKEAVRKVMCNRRGPNKKEDTQDAVSETLTRLLEPDNATALLSQARVPGIDPTTGREVNGFLMFIHKVADKTARRLKRRAVSRKEVRVAIFEGEEMVAPWDDHTRTSRQDSAEDKLVARIDLGPMLADADGQLALEYVQNRHRKAHTPAERVAFHRAKARLIKKYQERFTPAVTNGPAKGTVTAGMPGRDVRYTPKSTHFG